MSSSLIYCTTMYFAHNDKERCKFGSAVYINDVVILTGIWILLLGLTYAKEL